MRRRSVAVIGIFLSLSGRAFAGAWTPERGSAYQKVAYNHYVSGETFSPGREGFRRFTDNNVTYYGEYGLFDGVAVLGSLPVKRIKQTSQAGDTSTFGVGDVEIGGRYRLMKDPFVLSGQFIFKLPYLYDEHDSLPLGNGQEDFEGRLLFGKSLGAFGYVGLEGGYRLRRSAPADEFRYLVEYGINPTERLYLRTKLDAIESIDNGEAVVDALGNPTLPNSFDLGKLEMTIGARLVGRWFGEFTYTRDLYGRNTLAGENYQIAVIYSF